jgi:peptide/nickel transport system permease protein
MASEGIRTNGALVAGSVEAEFSRRRSLPMRMLVFARRKPLGAISVLVIATLVFVAIFAPILAPYDPIQTHPRDKLLSPGTQGHILGTDEFGRDVLSRIIHGARPSLTAGILATVFGTLVGAAIGLVGAYAGGKTDMVIQRVMDSIMALPGLILLLAVVNVLGRPSLINIIFALCIFITPSASRVVRGAVLGVKELQYVEGARSLGAQPMRIVLQHILPNVTAPIIIIASVTVGNAILIEAALSFLGLGVPPPNPTWGNMLSAGGRRWFEAQPWLAIIPGLAITITVLAFNLLGDTLRDVLDPRLRGTR